MRTPPALGPDFLAMSLNLRMSRSLGNGIEQKVLCILWATICTRQADVYRSVAFFTLAPSRTIVANIPLTTATVAHGLE